MEFQNTNMIAAQVQSSLHSPLHPSDFPTQYHLLVAINEAVGILSLLDVVFFTES